LNVYLRRQAKRLGIKPKAVITDAGYGSEENYAYRERQKITAVVKYGTWMKERGKKWKEDAFQSEKWEYNRKEKYYRCPGGRKLTLIRTYTQKGGSGFTAKLERYECESCKHCRLKKQCTRAKGNRSIERNERRLRLKRKAQRVLENEYYKSLRKQRSVEVETVFGQIKGNQGYRRFLLRGTAKVSTEWGLLSLGYNLKQLYRLSKEKAA
jgi:hypothetical protein